jgi:predicted urease superfamily metal-dependent hydrolase
VEHSKVEAVVAATLAQQALEGQAAQQVEEAGAAHLQQPQRVLVALAATVLSALQLGKEQKCQTDMQSLKTVWWPT